MPYRAGGITFAGKSASTLQGEENVSSIDLCCETDVARVGSIDGVTFADALRLCSDTVCWLATFVPLDWPSVTQASADPDPATTKLRVEAEKLEAGWKHSDHDKSSNRFDCRGENQQNDARKMFWCIFGLHVNVGRCVKYVDGLQLCF